MAEAVLYLALLGLVFAGMAGSMLRMAQGETNPEMADISRGEAASSIVPPILLGALVLLMGLYFPAGLTGMLHKAARLLGGF